LLTVNKALFFLHTFSTDKKTCGIRVAFADLAELVEDLQGKLSGRGHYQPSEAIILRPLLPVEGLEQLSERHRG